MLEQNSQTNGNSGGNGKKVEVIDLTLDSSSEEEEDEEPPQKKSCPSLSSISPQMDNGYISVKPNKYAQITFYGWDLRKVLLKLACLLACSQGTKSPQTSVSCESNSQHASGGYQLHSPTSSPHSGLPPLLLYTH